MSNFAKFLMLSMYSGILFVSVGLGWYVHPGLGLAVGGLMLTAISFAAGYESTPRTEGSNQ